MIANFPRPEKLANLANTPRTFHFHKLEERKCELRQGRCNMIRCLGPMHAERKFKAEVSKLVILFGPVHAAAHMCDKV